MNPLIVFLGVGVVAFFLFSSKPVSTEVINDVSELGSSEDSLADPVTDPFIKVSCATNINTCEALIDSLELKPEYSFCECRELDGSFCRWCLP